MVSSAFTAELPTRVAERDCSGMRMFAIIGRIIRAFRIELLVWQSSYALQLWWIGKNLTFVPVHTFLALSVTPF